MEYTLGNIKKNKFLIDTYNFTHNGINILLDINNSNFYSVENEYFDLIEYFEDKGINENDLESKYSKAQINEAIDNLINFGFLKDEKPQYPIISLRDNIEVINLVVNVSHNCNLRCKYCFASTGNYNGARDLMTKEMADTTLTWFLEQAKESKTLNLNLFGGEPLTNIPLVEYIVGRCKELEKEYDKKIYITISTNGTILNDKLIKLIKDNDIGLQISIDGDKEIHDANRPMAHNTSSYSFIEKNVKKLLDEVDPVSLIPRATVSKGTTDVNRIVNHLLYGMDFKCAALTPGLGSHEDTSYCEDDLPKYFEEYDELVETFLDKLRNGEEFNIYPFTSEVDAVSKGIRRIYGCGTGLGFASVDIKGNIFPCMRFIGNNEYKIGHVETGFNEVRKKFFNRTIYNRDHCKNCWARHLCGGACVAVQVECGEPLESYNSIVCKIAQYIAERAMYASTVIANENLHFDIKKLQVNDFIRRRFS